MSTFAYALAHRLNVCEVTTKTSSGNVTCLNEGVVVVNKTVGAATQVTLPASPTLGGMYPFVWVVDGKGDAATNNITVVAASGNINGAASYVISENYAAALFFFNGTEWNVAGTYKHNATVAAQTVTTLTTTTAVAAGLRFSDIGSINAAGSAIGNATAITNRFSVVGAADNAKGVQLPTPTAGDVYFVYSSVSANGLLVYPHTNGTIDSGSANASVAIEGRTINMFVAQNTTNWVRGGVLNS